jgi:hypothetical protein
MTIRMQAPGLPPRDFPQVPQLEVRFPTVTDAGTDSEADCHDPSHDSVALAADTVRHTRDT